MPGEHSLRSDEASAYRIILEQPSPDTSYVSFTDRTETMETQPHTSSHRKHRSTSRKRHKSRRDKGVTLETTIIEARHMSRLLAQDELEAAELRRTLVQTSERLDQESRRALLAETRAREAEARVFATEATKQIALTDVLRERETVKAYQVQVEAARADILKAQNELNQLAVQKHLAEEEAARERGKARQVQKEFEIQLALEKGRQEGYIDGREEGYRQGARWRKGRSYDDRSRSFSTTNSVTSPPPAAGSRSSRVSMPVPDLHADGLLRTSSAASRTKHHRSSSLSVHSLKSSKSLRHETTNLSEMPIASASYIRSSSPVTGPRPPSVKPPSERSQAPLTRPSSARPLSVQQAQGRISPVSVNTVHPSPSRSTSARLKPVSPLPIGFIPLVGADGQMLLPAPSDIDPTPGTPRIGSRIMNVNGNSDLPPRTPASPCIPLGPEVGVDTVVDIGVSNYPVINIEQPTPPCPDPGPSGMMMPQTMGSPRRSPVPNVMPVPDLGVEDFIPELEQGPEGTISMPRPNDGADPGPVSMPVPDIEPNPYTNTEVISVSMPVPKPAVAEQPGWKHTGTESGSRTGTGTGNELDVGVDRLDVGVDRQHNVSPSHVRAILAAGAGAEGSPSKPLPLLPRPHSPARAPKANAHASTSNVPTFIVPEQLNLPERAHKALSETSTDYSSFEIVTEKSKSLGLSGRGRGGGRGMRTGKLKDNGKGKSKMWHGSGGETEESSDDIFTDNENENSDHAKEMIGIRKRSSKLSIIMEGGSTVAGSPEPRSNLVTPRPGSSSPYNTRQTSSSPLNTRLRQYGLNTPTPMGVGGRPRSPFRAAGGDPGLDASSGDAFPFEQPIQRAPSPRPPHILASPRQQSQNAQRILNDPREYGEFNDTEAVLSPAALAHRRRIVAELRPAEEELEIGRIGAVAQTPIRDNVSIRSGSSTTAGAPRRRPRTTIPHRLSPSATVHLLEKHADVYDRFGSGGIERYGTEPDTEPEVLEQDRERELQLERERELQLARERELQERELQLARERELQERELQLARERELQERELQLARERELQLEQERELQLAQERELQERELQLEREREQRVLDEGVMYPNPNLDLNPHTKTRTLRKKTLSESSGGTLIKTGVSNRGVVPGIMIRSPSPPYEPTVPARAPPSIQASEDHAARPSSRSSTLRRHSTHPSPRVVSGGPPLTPTITNDHGLGTTAHRTPRGTSATMPTHEAAPSSSVPSNLPSRTPVRTPSVALSVTYEVAPPSPDAGVSVPSTRPTRTPGRTPAMMPVTYEVAPPSPTPVVAATSTRPARTPGRTPTMMSTVTYEVAPPSPTPAASVMSTQRHGRTPGRTPAVIPNVTYEVAPPSPAGGLKPDHIPPRTPGRTPAVTYEVAPPSPAGGSAPNHIPARTPGRTVVAMPSMTYEAAPPSPRGGPGTIGNRTPATIRSYRPAGLTPALNNPLPLSTATTSRGLPDGSRGGSVNNKSRRNSQVGGVTYEAAPPDSFDPRRKVTPSNVPLSTSNIGTPRMTRTPARDVNPPLATGATVNPFIDDMPVYGQALKYKTGGNAKEAEPAPKLPAAMTYNPGTKSPAAVRTVVDDPPRLPHRRPPQATSGTGQGPISHMPGHGPPLLAGKTPAAEHPISLHSNVSRHNMWGAGMSTGQAPHRLPPWPNQGYANGTTPAGYPLPPSMGTPYTIAPHRPFTGPKSSAYLPKQLDPNAPFIPSPRTQNNFIFDDDDMFDVPAPSLSKPRSPVSFNLPGASPTSIPQSPVRPPSRTSNRPVSPSPAITRPPSRGAGSVHSANIHSAARPVSAFLIPPGEVVDQNASSSKPAVTIESVTDEDDQIVLL
ncbi:hypothetical protein BU17DRAFT_89577 [Hysterangium stoloniferum]|nr:hypothetical protein BU17DRAFT_89577 [Hysterangium stoloniferum]